jgi:hypothetical protein
MIKYKRSLKKTCFRENIEMEESPWGEIEIVDFLVV